jgi:mono/diheme cytochrome c family protein
MRRRSYLTPTVALLLIAACSGQKATQSPSESAQGPVAYSSNGWSNAERAEYYHLAEGSELMPYKVLANVVSIKTGKPFLEQMERFGFIPDAPGPTNPHGLPIGMTVGPSRNAKFAAMEMTGFNCAACHVGEITYRGKHLRIDGAPSLINLQAYQIELKESLDSTLKNPKKLLALVSAMHREEKAPDTPSDESATKYAEDSSIKTAGDVSEAPTADPAFRSVPSAVADAATQSSPGKLSFSQRLKIDLALLKARLAYLKNGRLLVDGTEPGPGRVDAFGAARNLLFSKYAVKMQSPVSFPFIWNVPDNTQPNAETRWIHYDGNTNSILERNIGQALGMGAVFEPKTFESTLRIGNLHRLEVLTHKLQPPKWPAEVLGPIDETKAKAGEQIFNNKCKGCHQDRLYPLSEVGTDSNRANSFGQPVAGKPFPEMVAPILSGLKKRAFQDDSVSEADQARMDAKPVVWRATGQYLARPLQGIWATAPYLHNGSVPTLYHMLHPEQRPGKFAIGSHEYDPEKVGYASDLTADGGAWVYDTATTGNSNIGHTGDRFGTTLPEEQKAALLEYLKTL